MFHRLNGNGDMMKACCKIDYSYTDEQQQNKKLKARDSARMRSLLILFSWKRFGNASLNLPVLRCFLNWFEDWHRCAIQCNNSSSHYFACNFYNVVVLFKAKRKCAHFLTVNIIITSSMFSLHFIALYI